MTNKRPSADVPIAHFIARVLGKLSREHVVDCFEGLWREIENCKPDSYSLELAKRLLSYGDTIEAARAFAVELSEERVKEAERRNAYDAERFRKIAPLESSLGEVVKSLRGLKACLDHAQEALGEPLETLDGFVSKDRW